MRKLRLKQSFTFMSLGLCLFFTTRLDAQDMSNLESGKATLFWQTPAGGYPRWDLSEEPGVYFYVEQLSKKRPHDKVVYIAYGPLGEVVWYLSHIKGWLRDVGGTREDLIYTFDGGRENKLRYEAWLIPEGAEMPKVNAPVEDENARIQFASYPYLGVCEYCPGKGRATLDALVEALLKRPQRKAYLEFYTCGGQGRFSYSAARREMLKVKQILIREGGIASSRILVKIKADSKKSCEAQIWLTPSHLKFSQKVTFAR